MKKNVLASSVAAALVGLGMAGAAHANKVLVVPYYTAQAEHATLLNIVNSDTANGKIVKVRFRGAANSDDVFDFQAFLSPGDVWSGRVSSSEDGPAMLATEDASCTKPSKTVLNSTPFVTSRLNPSLTTAQKANQTREGYVEIFAMADVPRVLPGQPDVNKDGVNDLYTAIKHVSGVAPCSGAAWTALDKATANVGQRTAAATSVSEGAALGMVPPTPGLFSNFTIINVARAGAWDGEAENMSAFDIVDPTQANRVPYWPQTQVSVGASVRDVSADPLFLTGTDVFNYTGVSNVSAAAVSAAYYDLPDLSTPYVGDLSGPARPAAQALALATVLSTQSISNEFLVGPAEATTDWVFSMPTRRYAVAMNYAHTGTGDGRRFNAVLHNAHFSAANTVVVGGLICVTGISREIYNREEGTVANPDEVVISPSEIPPATAFCGEASVLSINGGGATTTETLSANVAVNDIDTTFQEGWMRLFTPAAGGVTYTGLPVLGAAYTRALSGDSFFAGSWKHRTGFGIN